MVLGSSPGLFARNLTALRQRSPRTADRLPDPSSSRCEIRTAANGAPVLAIDGRPLDSLRDPAASALRSASPPAEGAAVVVGLASGYVVDALIARGVAVAAIVADPPEALATLMTARDLTTIFSSVPVLLADEALDATTISALRARGGQLVPHAPSLSASAALRLVATAWAEGGEARRARMLVVGPFSGGSLDPARAVARALSAMNVETRFFDAAGFGTGFDALGSLAVAPDARGVLQNRFATLVGDAVVELASTWRPDLVFALAQAPLDVPALERLRALDIRTAFWFVENGRVLTYWRQIARAYDFFYAIQPGAFLEALAAAGAPRPRYLPMACDPDRHRPVVVTAEERKRYGSRVSFAGAPYLNRRRTFAAIADVGLRLWGPGWKADRLLTSLAASDERFDLETMLRIFAASDINLNLHSAEHVDGLDPDPDYVNPRTFELAACGVFQLTDRRSPLDALFEADEVATFDSVAELGSKIAYYLDRPDERVAIAARGRARALRDHTYAARMRAVVRDTLPAPLAASALSAYRGPTLASAIDEMTRSSATLTGDEAILRMVRELAPAGAGG